MNRLVPSLLAGAALAATVAGFAQGAEGGWRDTVVVLGGRAAESPALIERASALADRAHAQLRVPRTAGDELGVTHLFAARHYATVIAVDLDARVAVAPVQARYPGTRFVEVDPTEGAIARALSAGGVTG
jgi:hypothetical protein